MKNHETDSKQAHLWPSLSAFGQPQRPFSGKSFFRLYNVESLCFFLAVILRPKIKKNNDKNMEIITMESEAYQSLVDRIGRIEQFVIGATAKEHPNEDDVWIGTQEACQMMGISERTMQQYRTDGIISYKHCGKFCRYRLSDVKSLKSQGYGTGQRDI